MVRNKQIIRKNGYSVDGIHRKAISKVCIRPGSERFDIFVHGISGFEDCWGRGQKFNIGLSAKLNGGVVQGSCRWYM